MAESPMEQGELQSSPEIEIEFGTEDSHLSDEEDAAPSPDRYCLNSISALSPKVI